MIKLVSNFWTTSMICCLVIRFLRRLTDSLCCCWIHNCFGLFTLSLSTASSHWSYKITVCINTNSQAYSNYQICVFLPTWPELNLCSYSNYVTFSRYLNKFV